MCQLILYIFLHCITLAWYGAACITVVIHCCWYIWHLIGIIDFSQLFFKVASKYFNYFNGIYFDNYLSIKLMIREYFRALLCLGHMLGAHYENLACPALTFNEYASPYTSAYARITVCPLDVIQRIYLCNVKHMIWYHIISL